MENDMHYVSHFIYRYAFILMLIRIISMLWKFGFFFLYNILYFLYFVQ